MEIGAREISELTGYGLSKVRKDMQRGKLRGLEEIVCYVIGSRLADGLESVSTLVRMSAQGVEMSVEGTNIRNEEKEW